MSGRKNFKTLLVMAVILLVGTLPAWAGTYGGGGGSDGGVRVDRDFGKMPL